MAIKISSQLEAKERLKDLEKSLKTHLGDQYYMKYRLAGLWYEGLYCEYSFHKKETHKVFLFFKSRTDHLVCEQNFNLYRDKDFRISKQTYISLPEIEDLSRFVEENFKVDLLIV